MSISTAIDANNPDPIYRGKFYPDLIPFDHPPAQQGLGSVLQVSNSALTPIGAIPQDATDFNTIGCIKVETGTVGQGNNLALVVGEAGDNLQIKGATLLGSILAGNGVNTETLALGTNGYVLTADSTAGVGVKWASAGGAGVASITPGSNIGVNNAIPTAPVVSVLNPLTSTLNLGTQSITGSTSNITLSSGTNQANMNGNLGFTSASQITPTTKANLFNTSISVETSTNKVAIAPTSITKTGLSPLTIGTVGSASLSFIGNGGGQDGIQIQQTASLPTTLTTSLSNIKYYPDTLITNNNLNTIAVPLPQVDYQRLTLTNLGLTNTNSWNDYGNAIFSPLGFEAFFIDSNSNVWLAENGTGNIRVCDNPPVNILHNITMANSAGSPVAVNVFYEQGGYVFIGGTFDSINGNATPQYNITRVNLSSYTEDPMGDTVANVYGTGANYTVYGMTDVNGVLAFCGNFLSLSNGTTASYICEITSPYVAGANQVYSEMLGGVNGQVFAVFYNSNRVFFGGDFTTVDNSSPIGYAYGAYYDYNTSAWLDVANNSLNGSVYIIKPTAYGYIFLGGAFTAPQTSPYSCYIEDATPQNSADTSLLLTSAPTYKHAYGVGATLGVYGSGTPSLYVSSNFQSWVDLGQPGSGSDVTGVNFWSGNYKVIYNNYEYVRTHATLPHSCIFTGVFKYDGTIYNNYTITLRNVSQQFIGDDGESYWSIIGLGVGTFS